MTADTSAPPAASATKVAASQTSEALKRATAAAESLRQRSDIAAKVVAGAGTTLLTAVGLSKFSDIWPYPPGSWLAALLLISGFALMGLAVVMFAIRLWKLQEPIVMRSDLSKMNDLTPAELSLITPLYEEAATINEVASLSAYEDRAHRLERIAKWLPPTEAERVSIEADLIINEVLTIFARARVRILRGRFADALRGGGAIMIYTLFGAGVLLFGLSADWLQSERTDKVAVAKACADARAVPTVVESELPAICGDAAVSPADSQTTYQERANANAELAAILVDCLAVAKHDSDCDSIKEAMDVVLPP
jgi:hypothetical protein